MNIYNKKITLFISMFMLLVSSVSYAKVRAVKARRDFEQSIAKESMVVALFYDDRDRDLTRMYEDVSTTQRYDDADVVFLKVNAARQELSNLARLYHVTKMPTFIFFHKGKPVIGKKAAAQLVGSVSRGKLQSFIDKYFGEEIDKYIAQKNARNERRIEQEKESGYNWKEYFYPRTMNVPSYTPDERDLE